jgi:hypothetical protein
MVGVLLTLTVSVSAFAQGNGKGKGQGQGPGHKSTPPSQISLPDVGASVPGGALPFAWIDDATLIPAGAAAVSMTIVRWQGSDLSEIEAPVFGVAYGISNRVQLGLSVPHVVGDDATGIQDGMGTTFASLKIGVLGQSGSDVKLAVAPSLEVLSKSAAEALGPDESRAHVGLPVSLEVDHGALRVFASAGYFSGGTWFAGGGAGTTVGRRGAVGIAFDRAWMTDETGAIVHDRRDLSGSAAFAVSSRVSVFGSLGTTVATADLDGAGVTVNAGILITFGASGGR